MPSRPQGPGGPKGPDDSDHSNHERREDPHTRLRRTNDELREVLDRLDGFRGWPVAEGDERRTLELRMYELSTEVADLLEETRPSREESQTCDDSQGDYAPR